MEQEQRLKVSFDSYLKYTAKKGSLLTVLSCYLMPKTKNKSRKRKDPAISGFPERAGYGREFK